MDKIFVMKRFLRKLINLNIWGGRHTELLNLRKYIPKHLRGEKVTEKAIKELVANGFLTIKKSTGEIHVSLNNRIPPSMIGGQVEFCVLKNHCPPR